jgi:hypothetical protein
MHEFYYWAKDNVCHPSTIYHETFYVDSSKPYVEISFPDHGYYTENDKEYLKCYTDITLDAYDLPDNECMSDIEGIYWRYEWDGSEYPTGAGPGIVTGNYLASTYGYTADELIGHDWYFTDQDTANVMFPEECVHEFYYWAKDNLCHNSTIYNRTLYVDNTPPNVTLEINEPYCVFEENGKIVYKVSNLTKIWVNATDLPENECAAGVESIFWRYYNKTGEHPYPGEQGGYDGAVIAAKYGYTDPDIIDYWWYNETDASAFVQFENECQHDLYYWAKDNVCNRTEIFNQTFYVDMTPPPNVSEIKEVGEPHAVLQPSPNGHDQWMVFPETPICFNLTDFEDLGCGPKSQVTIWYRIWYLGSWTDWMEYTECIYLTNGCVHYLEAYAEDCLGNKGEVDNETFWVCGPGGETGPDITILEPYFGETICDEKVTVKIEASDDKTPTDQLEIVVWIPGGRRDAPTLWYYPVYDNGYFYVDIDIYNYQNGAYLTLMALAKDEDNNVEFAEPTEFIVCSTTIWDQWLQYGWNKLELPFGVCNDDVERVLACLNNSGIYSYDGIYHYDPDVYPVYPHWGSYSPYLEDIYNTLWNIQSGKQYWIHCTEAEGIRYFIGLPDLEIENPIDEETYDDLDEINGTVWSSDSEIISVELQIYYKDESSVKHYWNGTGWETIAHSFSCDITGGYHKQWSWDSSGVTWIIDETYYAKAVATDEYGCLAGDVHTFDIIEVS